MTEDQKSALLDEVRRRFEDSKMSDSIGASDVITIELQPASKAQEETVYYGPEAEPVRDELKGERLRPPSAR